MIFFCSSKLIELVLYGIILMFTLKNTYSFIFSRSSLRPFVAQKLYVSSKNNYNFQDTIYALSSGSFTKSGVAVLRLSGPLAIDCLKYLNNPKSEFKQPKERLASLKSLYCPKSKELLDKGLVLWFPSPKSFTGEDVVELHVHGSRAVISGLFKSFEYLDSISNNGRIRPAEKGEFTQRAFENGKMDLTEVEGLGDLLVAETSEQRKLALKQMEGSLKEAYENWRAELLTCLAHFEAIIDFGDDDREGDITDEAIGPVYEKVLKLTKELEKHLKRGERGEIIREGVQITIVGQPNAGKSSLLNALARRPAAIVSPIAGTTRDIVEVKLDIDGLSCILRDTAGIRFNTTDLIEREGIDRAKKSFKESHINLLVIDMSSKSLEEDLNQLFASLQISEGKVQSSQSMIIFNKIDCIEESKQELTKISVEKTLTKLKTIYPQVLQGNNSINYMSCKNDCGIDDLEEKLGKEIKILLLDESFSENESNNILITRERHRVHVKRCLYHLNRFLDENLPIDLAAEEIRLAMVEIGKVTGLHDIDELLDIIFRDFCIGK